MWDRNMLRYIVQCTVYMVRNMFLLSIIRYICVYVYVCRPILSTSMSELELPVVCMYST